jgi:hypothetical protein
LKAVKAVVRDVMAEQKAAQALRLGDEASADGAAANGGSPPVTADGLPGAWAKSSSDGGNSWEEPVPIDRPDMPSFPAHTLPGPLRTWALATAEASQTPVEMAGLLGLAICSGAMAGRVKIQALRGYVESLNFWTVMLEPANRKSSVFKAAKSPLRDSEAELAAKARPLVARQEIERELILARIKSEKRNVANGDAEAATRMTELGEELQNLPVPRLPQLITDNCTSEGSARLLRDQGGRMAVVGPEGGIFYVLGGLYSGGVPNVENFLRGHVGDDLTVDRASNSAGKVNELSVTMAYLVRPHVSEDLGRKPAMLGLGLLERVEYAIPESRIGFRRVNTEPVPDAGTEDYGQLIRRLAGIQEGVDGPRTLVLSPAASERFISWSEEVESMLLPDGRLGSMKDWGGKLFGLTARFAGVMHLVRFANSADPVAVPVELATIESAIELARWAIPHAEAAYSLMAADDGSIDDAVYVLEKLRKRASSEVRRPDIQTLGRSRFDRNPTRLDRALAVLVDRGWLRPIENGPRGPGRPSERYQVHPSVTRPLVPRISRSAGPPGAAGGEESPAA